MYIADGLSFCCVETAAGLPGKTVEEASESTTLQQRDQVALYRAKGLFAEVERFRVVRASRAHFGTDRLTIYESNAFTP